MGKFDCMYIINCHNGKTIDRNKNLILFVWFQWLASRFNLDIIKYCEINICSWLHVFKDFVVYLKTTIIKIQSRMKYSFSIDLLHAMFETKISRTHGSLHFVENIKISDQE